MCFIYINTDVGWLVEQRRKALVTLRLCSTSCPLSGYVVIKRFCLFVCFAKLVINCALFIIIDDSGVIKKKTKTKRVMTSKDVSLFILSNQDGKEQNTRSSFSMTLPRAITRGVDSTISVNQVYIESSFLTILKRRTPHIIIQNMWVSRPADSVNDKSAQVIFHGDMPWCTAFVYFEDVRIITSANAAMLINDVLTRH